MPAELSALLFVFMLATFIGLGVITRVSRLLHTPLMSLTNAISAIAVVGSIVIAGQRPPAAHHACSARSRSSASMTNIVSGFLITDRMLKMFKKPGERQEAHELSALVELAYLVAAALFIFSLHWMNDPTTARTRRRSPASPRMALGDRRHAADHPASSHWGWIAVAVVRRLRGRRAAVAGAAHRGAAADRALARVRRPGRGPGRHRQVLPVAARGPRT